MSDSILSRGLTYEKQLAPIRSLLADFAQQQNWQFQRLGRKPVIGVIGPVAELSCNVRIESEVFDWDDLPAELYPDMKFWLTATCHPKESGLVANAYLHWSAPYQTLDEAVPAFLNSVMDLLNEIRRGYDLIKVPDRFPKPDSGTQRGPIRRFNARP